ncbi:hypothetical protein MUP77_19320 [Candidatus Bathyarchaeota archaeon]|nr:hypothetical protein [Candidatus Bathyarchaeota archaeon]
MSTLHKIGVIGGAQFQTQRFDESEMTGVDIDKVDHLAEYDIIIYESGLFPFEYYEGRLHNSVRKPPSPSAVRRENEMRLALEKGKIVCLIRYSSNDYVIYGILKSNSINCEYFGRSIESSDNVQRQLRCKRSEFKPFVDDLGATCIYFDENSVSDVICLTDSNYVIGFSKNVGKGLLLFIPCLWGTTQLKYIIEHLKSLSAALVSYSSRIISEPPSWINNFKFSEEKKIEEEIMDIESREFSPRTKKIKHYNSLKSILWLVENNLVDALDLFFKNIGFKTLKDDISEEDLWLVKNDEKIVIIEVKSKNKNLTRDDISKLDEHRARGLFVLIDGLLNRSSPVFCGAENARYPQSFSISDKYRKSARLTECESKWLMLIELE